jgi:GntR family transcriptional regulator
LDQPDESPKVGFVASKASRSVPLRQYRYLAIADEIRAQLNDGSLEPGALLPTESQLAATYEASRVTVRKALQSLRIAGLVEARRGYGWSVLQPPIRRTLATRGFEEPLTRAGVAVERKVLDFALVNPEDEVREALECDRVLYVKLVTIADGVPVAAISVWLPEELAQEITPASWRSGGSVYDVLPDITLGHTSQSIAARLPTEPEAELLQIAANTPVLLSRRVSKDATGTPVLLAHLVYPSNIMEFVVEVPGGETEIISAGPELPRPRAAKFA